METTGATSELEGYVSPEREDGEFELVMTAVACIRNNSEKLTIF